MYIYPDGGYLKDTDKEFDCAWSIAVAAQDVFGKQALVGTVGGQYLNVPGMFGFVDDSKMASSFTPELYAQMIARVFIVRHLYAIFPGLSCPIYICFDSQSAGNVAVSPRDSKANQLLSAFTTVLDNYLACRNLVVPSHVYAHSSHP